eukprot:scaffold244600_cov10-Tisochrysis_lutea.AAC.1
MDGQWRSLGFCKKLQTTPLTAALGCLWLRGSKEVLLLHPMPLAFHNVVMEVQDGFVSQVQVVRRLLLHEKLKVRYFVLAVDYLPILLGHVPAAAQGAQASSLFIFVLAFKALANDVWSCVSCCCTRSSTS